MPAATPIIFSGLVGRDGNFWVENVPFNTGTNWLALTLSNSAGGTTTNFTLIQSSIALSVNPVQAGDTTVSGTIGTNGYTVWVNGVQAAQNSGAWTAQIAPLGVSGGLVQVTAIPNTDNGSNGTGGGGSGGGGTQNPNSPQSVNTQASVAAPQGVFLSQYHTDDEWSGQMAVSVQDETNVTTTAANQYWRFNWQDGAGGTNDGFTYFWGFIEFPMSAETTCPETSWPQPFPATTTTTVWSYSATAPRKPTSLANSC